MGKYLNHSGKPEKKKTGRKMDWKQNLVLDFRDFLHVLAIFMLIYVLFFRLAVVQGDSMRKTLVDGDRLVLLSNLFYTEPKRGDIIVASKQSFEDGNCIVKRVIATEGQTVDIDFLHGIVYVDGVALDEPYTLTPTNTQEGVTFPLTVAPGCVFVMGDNRNISKDSRSIEIGLIDCRQILGKAIFLLTPGSDEGRMKPDFGRIGVIW